MIISEHARKAMLDDNIREEEVRWCIQHGEDKIDVLVGGEQRYGKLLRQKQRDIMVVYTNTNQGPRVITAFIIKRRKQWH